MIEIAAAALLSYLVGSIPTSIIIGKLFYHKDPREHGSGNAGGTNAFRVFGWKAGIVVIAVDVGKGAFASLVISRLGYGGPIGEPGIQLLAGASAVVGHIWTVFAGFRGGKGVGTAAGMLLGIYPLPFAVAVLAFVVGLTTTGWVSAGSIAAAVVFPIAAWILAAVGYPIPAVLLYASILFAALIVFTHRRNIARIVKGTENRFPKLMLFKRRTEEP
jgi:acyl phosphate:glycerol-3-phosphate acyltransferase